MEQSPSWEANWCSANQEIPAFYGTRMFITTQVPTTCPYSEPAWSSQ